MEHETAIVALIVAGIAALEALKKLINVVTEKIRKSSCLPTKKELSSEDLEELRDCLLLVKDIVEVHDKAVADKISELRDILREMLKDNSSTSYNSEKVMDKVVDVLQSLEIRIALIESYAKNKPHKGEN